MKRQTKETEMKRQCEENMLHIASHTVRILYTVALCYSSVVDSTYGGCI